MAGKEGIFFIIDTNESMNKQYDESLTRMQFAIESLRHLIRQKFLFNPKDQIGIILKGDVESSNLQNLENISVFRSLNFPNIEQYEQIEKIQTSSAQGDIFDSIEVAVENFIAEYGKRKWIKRIFLITDGESAIDTDPARINYIAKKLNENDVKVNIVTVNFFNELDDEEGSVKETENQKLTKEVLNKLAEKSGNLRIFTAEMANSIQKQFRKKKINPITKFRGPLILTEDLYIDVAVYTKTNKVELPSLKKQSLATEFSERIKAGEIQNERVYYVNDDPDQNPLDQQFITKAYNYGNSLVPVSKTDEVLFKNEESKCLKAIGFSDSFRIPRHFFLGGVDIVIPNPENDTDIQTFTAFVMEMLETNKVLICRYVYRNNAEPKLVVLTPHMSKRGAILYLNTLPSVEDIRDYQFESLKECTIKQEEVVSKFIDTLDLDQVDEEGNEEEILKPSETFNPVLQYFYQCLEQKALKKDNNLPSLDEAIGDYLKPNKNLFENNKYVSFLPKIFDIKEKEKEDKKKRVFWREMINSELQESTGISDRRLEEKLESHKEAAKKLISATRPIEDFKEMINYKYEDLTVDAMNQMEDIIIKFILESFKGSYYIKSIECIKELRDACIDEDEVLLFNEFLEKLRHDFPKEKFMDFWRLFIDNRIAFISNKENVKSFKSESECKEWIESINKKEIITSTLKDLDDLIADID